MESQFKNNDYGITKSMQRKQYHKRAGPTMVLLHRVDNVHIKGPEDGKEQQNPLWLQRRGIHGERADKAEKGLTYIQNVQLHLYIKIPK